ncbi:hypothetical protein DMN91_007899 [Ooceraea biroi]|uniref:Uncharacterized protein n=1 Tax=Ooceraea biroi TaxID=2015173 RepID=A0A3L8DGP0_OOCBI|nr:hypothetical protein DMN91_007899 [Ooceraea biroi]
MVSKDELTFDLCKTLTHVEVLASPRSSMTSEFLASSPELRTCPYLGKFTVTGVNQRNQRNTRESRRSQHPQESLPTRRDGEKVRHAQERNEDRRSRKLDYEVEKRRANNEYLVHERMGRRARSNRGCNRAHKGDYSLEKPSEAWSSSELGDVRVLHDRERISRLKVRKPDASDSEQHTAESKLKIDDAIGRFWAVDPDDSWTTSTLQVQDDYFGDYLESESLPQKRSTSESLTGKGMTYKDLLRMKRELEEREKDEDAPERREKRNEDESRCSSEVTTLTVGCSTADRMEFQSDCLDDDAITAYSCHGRWFDAEGTQFVIATPLARRTAWSNSENNRAQPYRNTRRLCFMYKESGGVVSLTASPVACQRGIPPPAPMLAFNATSTGQCMEANGGQISRSTYLIVLLTVVAAIFR